MRVRKTNIPLFFDNFNREFSLIKKIAHVNANITDKILHKQTCQPSIDSVYPFEEKRNEELQHYFQNK